MTEANSSPELEPIIEPDLEIIDAHHHLWDRPGSRYLVDNFLEDAHSGHNVTKSVHVQCRAGYHHLDPDPHGFAPIAETEFIERITRESVGTVEVGAAIVGYANTMLGSYLEPVITGHVEAARGRFRGIRHIVAWDSDRRIFVEGYNTFPGMLRTPQFREAMKVLEAFQLHFEVMVFHPQLPEIAQLAAAFPNITFILNHIGVPLRIGSYQDHRPEVFREWSDNLHAVAQNPNVVLKVGGLGIDFVALATEHATTPQSSATVANAYRPFIETCIETFGISRCMFESNFPVDRPACSYRTLWNAFKRITLAYGDSEKSLLYSGTAMSAYRLSRLDHG